MAKRNPWLWPKNGHIFIRNGRGRELAGSSDRRYDLADSVMLCVLGQKTVTIAFSINRENSIPSETEALRLENLIRDDFGFDGYGVTLTKLEPTGLDTYAWRARIRPKI